MKRKYSILFLLFAALGSVFYACSDDDGTALKNDLLKKTYGPNVVGNEIEFAYIMGVPGSKLEAAYVEASIPGADGTGFEDKSYHTNSTGADVGVVVATDCTTTGGKSQAIFIDTLVAALRYHYIIPEEAFDKKVSFTFTCKAKNGETVSFRADDQVISKVRMKKGIVLTSGDRCYLSIRNMAAYTLAEVQAQNLESEIDLIYNYKAVTGVAYGHALLSPGSPEEYREGAVIPPNAVNTSKIEKHVYTYDRHLGSGVSDGGYSFVDDIDFRSYDPGPALPFALNFAVRNGIWVISADGKQKAFMQVNSVGANTMTVSMKSYAM